VEGRSRSVKPDIAGDDLLRRQRVKRGGVGRLVNIAALIEQTEEGGLETHGGGLTDARNLNNRSS
jgi:hypothetical protein